MFPVNLQVKIFKDSYSEKGTRGDEMAGWHQRLDGNEFAWTPGGGDGQGGLACCNSWGHRVGHDWATKLNWTDAIFTIP